ncbi:PepSY domain-containing protein [Nocardioides gilvus]|uniref:PepSY domain-containing protein n=1 Tax=Nocardioides gilvus TaxID=1735589 RepID=UPI000D74699B|nr:PepSY domain-containing protein [Nocardioides gilvus]
MKLTSRTARSLASVAAVALLVSGCSDDAGDQTNTTNGTPSPTGTPPTETPQGASPSGDPSAAPGVSAVDAHDAALEEVPGDVLSIDREDSLRWEVLVRGTDGSGTEVWVDATSGDVIEQRTENVPAEARDGAPAFTAQEAMEAAQAAVTDSTVTDLDIDREGGKVVWDVVVEAGGVETDVQIDAANGELLKQEQDD